ncbi:MAG TPA: PQQ-binding-like beta-propeller repeat protein [Cyclobacteriaceae bacterium]|jgi:sugar lactone lactonase YvrE
MKNLLFVLFAISFLVFSCRNSKKESAEAVEQDTPAAPALTQKWETDTVLTTCESVLYDADRNVLYVSNINGVPDQKDGNGSIARVSLDGTVTDPAWVTGLDAPKGMGIRGNRLFVTDIDKIVEIDVDAGKIVKSYPIEGASFLNDVTVAANGDVYASDSNAGFIVKISGEEATVWMQGVDGPNGLLADGGTLLMASWAAGTLNAIDLQSQETTVKAEGIEHPDGIEPVGDGAYLVSTWDGMVHLVNADGSKHLLLDTRESGANAADIEYIPEQNLLLVPAFSANKVVAYELSK